MTVGRILNVSLPLIRSDRRSKHAAASTTSILRLKVNLKNNLIALLDGTFPDVNTLFKSAPRDIDGHEKWVDFAGKFWRRKCVCRNTEKVFTNQHRRWCAKAGYKFSEEKAESFYAFATSQVNTLPMTASIKCLVTLAVAQLNTIIETVSLIQMRCSLWLLIFQSTLS